MKNKHGIEILPDKGFSGQRKKIQALAAKHNWHQICHQAEVKMVSFNKSSERINVYYTTMTVATCIQHPKFGKTQLFRKDVSLEELEQIFVNPRVHTEKGYYMKGW